MNRYGLFGTHISHSLSPKLHQIFSTQTGHPMQYTIYETPADQFEVALSNFFKEGGIGANITAPFKSRAYQFADSISEQAKKLGSVNTLKKCKDGSIEAINTDGLGLVQDLEYLGLLQKGKTSILIIGSGSAALSAVDALLNYQVRSITLLNRTVEHAKKLIQKMHDERPAENLSLNLLFESDQKVFDLIINATTAGTEISHFLKNFVHFSDITFYYDMSYAPMPTSFLSWVSHHTTVRCASGLGMLIEQGALSFQWWHGIKADPVNARQKLISIL